jgi:DNA-binding HxlR family transcriptional regulator
MKEIQIITVNELQKLLLAYLLDHHSVSCNMAGDRLAKAKLLKRTPQRCSNLCLAGSAVLRSLEKIGFVHQFLSSRDQWAIKLYALSPRGRTLAEHLRKSSPT